MNFKPLDDLLLKLFQSQARRFRQQLLHELGCQIFVHDRMAPCLLPVVAIVFDLVIPLHIVHHGLRTGFVYFRERVYIGRFECSFVQFDGDFDSGNHLWPQMGRHGGSIESIRRADAFGKGTYDLVLRCRRGRVLMF
jgi:hypothetical protein